MMYLLIHIADKIRATPNNAQSIWRTNQCICGPLLTDGAKDKCNACEDVASSQAFPDRSCPALTDVVLKQNASAGR
jgi:hypothetical protein